LYGYAYSPAIFNFVESVHKDVPRCPGNSNDDEGENDRGDDETVASAVPPAVKTHTRPTIVTVQCHHAFDSESSAATSTMRSSGTAMITSSAPSVCSAPNTVSKVRQYSSFTQIIIQIDMFNVYGQRLGSFDKDRIW